MCLASLFSSQSFPATGDDVLNRDRSTFTRIRGHRREAGQARGEGPGENIVGMASARTV